MEALFLLVPLSLLTVLVAIILFFRMSSSGQFDDDQGPAFSILLDDDRPPLSASEREDAPVTGSKSATDDTPGSDC